MGAVELRAAWRGAADAAGLSKDDQGIRETPEMQLVAQAREAARVKAWEPADVSEERRDAELAKGEAAADALLSEAAARNAEGPDAAEAQQLATGFRQLAQGLSVRAAWLGEQDEHRREWHARTRPRSPAVCRPGPSSSGAGRRGSSSASGTSPWPTSPSNRICPGPQPSPGQSP